MQLTKTDLTREKLARYEKIRNLTVAICAPLIPEDHVVQPIVDVSPPKWHLAHTTWFFETFVLKQYYKNYRIFDKDFNFIFNSYYESVGERAFRTHRGNLTRPSVSEVHEYRRYVDVFMKELLEREASEQLLDLVELGLQHEQQHQELLLTDIKYILGNNPLFPEYKRIMQPVQDEAKELRFIEIPEGMYEIGCENNCENFSFDNEQPLHKTFVPHFKIADRLVTNGEYLEFINDGVYKDFRFWLMEGFELVKSFNWEAPLYWIKKQGEWYEYTLGGLQKLNLNNPVTHISFYEADAFSKWAGKRLPTEFEWEAAAKYLNANHDKGNFAESGLFHPVPEKEMMLLGNAWQWTYSPYHPYPGYAQEEGALGEYNGKFMINQMVLRGGSCATPKDHTRVSYRNFFHPDKKWQFTGIRLCEKD
ncbi:MAG: ergothioneine biosynthesis protein EgtB [Cytophagaceae bacterium]|nr:ergothioneine biosynthesis protein EgtB [Cytophagaceae bacterium]